MAPRPEPVHSDELHQAYARDLRGNLMTTLKEIDAQLAALQAQREEIRKNELKIAVDKVRSLVAEYGLTESDVFPPARGARSALRLAPRWLLSTVTLQRVPPGRAGARRLRAANTTYPRSVRR